MNRNDANLIKNGTIGDWVVANVPDKNVGDLISRQAVLRCIKESRENIDWGQSEDGDAFRHYSAALYRTIASEECLPTIDAVPAVRCKYCKHRPIDTGGKGYGEDLSFDDGYTCPCRCEDPFYSWMPGDDWFCANGERKDDGKA